MIRLSMISKVDVEKYDEVWIVVRSANKLPASLASNPKVKHVPELSPETKLFYQYLDWKKNGNWCWDIFKNNYVPEFLREMNNPRCIALLNQLVADSHEKNIALCCFCPDEKLCHRSILGGVLKNMGADIYCNAMYDVYKMDMQP